MSITVKTSGKQQCISVSGELTIFTVSELWQSLQQILSKAQDVEIDLHGVSDLDTAGIQLLMIASKSRQNNASSVSFLNHSQAVIDGLELFDLGSYFGVPVVEKSDNYGVQS